MILLTSWVWFGNIQSHNPEEEWHHLWWEVIWCDKRRVISLKHSVLYFSFRKISITRLVVGGRIDQQLCGYQRGNDQDKATKLSQTPANADWTFDNNC